jgi:hypothetical protein
MPLTRFPDHEDRRVYLSTVLSFNLSPAETNFSDRPSIALLWVDEDTPAARELGVDFAIQLFEHGTLGVVIGGSAAERIGALMGQAVESGEFSQQPGEEIGIWVCPGQNLEEVIFTAAEEAMPPDAHAEGAWDLVAWSRSSDPNVTQLRSALGRVTDLVEDIYDLGGEDDE